MGTQENEVAGLLRLAVEAGLLSSAEAEQWLGRAETLPSDRPLGDLLVEQGVLAAEQLLDLRARLKTLVAPTEEAETVPARPEAEAGGRARFPSIPGYEVVGELGRGGMGVVYRAWQQRPHRLVALKVLRHGGFATDAQRRRFEREAQAAADLSHPGVVTIHEFGEVEGRPYFSMELVRGAPLYQYLATHTPTLREGLALMQRICEAVAYAHQRGVIHRDLKPANIMVDEEGLPKILDFGLVKITEAASGEAIRTLTLDGQLLGTVPYMAPEQTLAQPEEIDVRTDVYALGVILYEMLTGRLPHEPEQDHALELMRRIREEPPRRPSTVSRLIGDEVETIVLKALEKEKGRRYQSADALGADMGRYLAGEPIEAKRASALYQLRKFAYRRRAVVLPVVFSVLVGLALFGWAFLRVRAERNAAVAAEQEAVKQRTQAEEAKNRAQQQRDRAEFQVYRYGIEKADQLSKTGWYGGAEDVLLSLSPRYRSWEWGHLLCRANRRTLKQLLTLKGHSDEVMSVAFSPDGRRLASGSCDNTAKLWNTTTGEELLTLEGHLDWVTSVAFSPDGSRLASGSLDRTIRLWEDHALSRGRRQR